MTAPVEPIGPGGQGIDVSVVIPVSARQDDAAAVYRAYKGALEQAGCTVEFIYVLDLPLPSFVRALQALQHQGEPITIVELSQPFGEGVCLHVGVERARGERVLMLPPYFQIEPAALPTLIAALERADLSAAVRDRSTDHWLNRLRGAVLNRVARVAGSHLRDVGCLVVAARRRVLKEISMQDEHHRFLPLLAQNAGFVVEHIVLPQAAADRCFRMHGPSVYLGRMLDLLAIAFLLRFMQRPFRFFGSVGSVMAAGGLVLGAALAFERLVLQVPLAERPALLLAMLLVVLGVQIAAVGLIAEIIIFARSHRLATYRVDQVVEPGDPASVALAAEPAAVPLASEPTATRPATGAPA